MMNRRTFSRCLSSGLRSYTVEATQDIRPRLLAELKSAMKARNTMASITIRSVLSEVYAADKSHHPELLPNSGIVSIIRKAAFKRTENASQFEKGSRPDLAEKEHQEHVFLSQFLPPLLPEAQVDVALGTVIQELKEASPGTEGKKLLGQVLKSFYAKVDRSTVDPEVVKRRVEVLITSS